MPGSARPSLTPEQQLALVPLRNRRAEAVEDGPARLVLQVEAVYPRWAGPLPRLLGAPRHRRYQLDGLALRLWRRIDDRITLATLVDHLAEDQRLGFNEARLLTLHWLHDLAGKGLVVLGDRTGG